ncbi:DNA topoisomerase I, putative, partial [Acidithiobacillus sp. GGI-221]
VPRRGVGWLTDPGWRALYTESEDEGEGGEGKETEAANPVPKLSVGDKLKAERGEMVSKKTKAPPRYTESTLIKALEDHGVGRPSTYASIIKVLYKRDYMKRKGKAPALYATDLGEQVVDALRPFDFAGLAYTRLIEESLDLITEGKMPPRDLLAKSYADIQSTIATMPKGADNSQPCPVDGCGGTVSRRESKKKKGRSFGCVPIGITTICSRTKTGHRVNPSGIKWNPIRTDQRARNAESRPDATRHPRGMGFSDAPKATEPGGTTKVPSVNSGRHCRRAKAARPSPKPQPKSPQANLRGSAQVSPQRGDQRSWIKDSGLSA